jgi:hypothetical protein
MELELRKIAGDIVADINKQILLITSGEDDEPVHKLRTQYKKLRALLRAAGVSITMPAGFKELYHKAGSLRDYKLYYKEIEDSYKGLYGMPYEYFSVLEMHIYELRQQLLTSIASVNMQEVKEIILAALPGKLDDDKIKEFIKNNKARLKKLDKKKHTLLRLHAMRKHLKDIMYILEISGEGKNKDLEKITTKLGSYNDRSRFLFLSKHIKDEARGTEKQLFKALRKNWKQKRRKLRKKILRKRLA